MQYATLAMTSEPATLDVYTRLSACAAGLPNDALLAKMLASQTLGIGALPRYLGLSRESFSALFVRHFPGAERPTFKRASSRPLNIERYVEQNDIAALLLEHRARVDVSEFWMAKIIAAACMGGNHLWQDLGLWSRTDVTTLLKENFPALAAKNTADMKWKKFLYKQLCQQEGVYVCRAPSCNACVDYSQCFGPET